MLSLEADLLQFILLQITQSAFTLIQKNGHEYYQRSGTGLDTVGHREELRAVENAL